MLFLLTSDRFHTDSSFRSLLTFTCEDGSHGKPLRRRANFDCRDHLLLHHIYDRHVIRARIAHHRQIPIRCEPDPVGVTTNQDTAKDNPIQEQLSNQERIRNRLRNLR